MFRSDTKVLGPLGTGHLSPIRDRLSITSGANLWEAYRQLEEVKGGRPISELAALVALVRRVIGIDGQLTTYKSTIDKNFKQWVFDKQAGAAEKFTAEQMEWLRMLKDHIVTSFHVAVDDLDYTPFDARGGRGKMWQLFGDRMTKIMEELNEALAG